MDRLVRLSKFLNSFLTSNWSLSDYPVRVREQENAVRLPMGSHLKPVRWSARIIGWPMISGHADTRSEALGNLAEAFQRRVASGKRLPRPGTECSEIEFAPTDRWVKVESLAPKFFTVVLEMNYDNCFISDESSLWDFHAETDNSRYLDRIRDAYGVDASDIESGNLVEILERVRLLSPSA